MRETLFIGGPWDGRVEDVRENAKFVNAVDGPFEPHEYTIETIRAPAGCLRVLSRGRRRLMMIRIISTLTFRDLRECICNPGLAECPVHGKGGPT